MIPSGGGAAAVGAGPVPAALLANGAHLLSGAALALSFVLLYQQREQAMVRTYAAQALLAALLLALHGWNQGSLVSLPGSVLLAAGAVAVPAILRRQGGLRLLRPGRFPDRGPSLARSAGTASDGASSPTKPGGDTAIAAGAGAVASMVVGVAVVAVAVFAVQSAPLPLPGSSVPTREDLAFALAVVLLGLLTAARRGTALARAIGLLSMWNGLVLAVAGDAASGLLAAGSAGLLAPAAAAAFDGEAGSAAIAGPGFGAARDREPARSTGMPAPDRIGRAE